MTGQSTIAPARRRARAQRAARCSVPKMWFSYTAVVMALALCVSYAPTSADAVDILFRNLCGEQMTLSDGKTTEKIQKDGAVKHTLPPGSIKAYRYSSSNQATLAEFSVKNTTTWYDIGIIPTNTFKGPGECTSLDDCKKVTGGTGFNVAMKIVPDLDEDSTVGSRCRTLNCFADGCDDAYQFPHDNEKTHNCPSMVRFSVIFCATPATGSSDADRGWSTLEAAGIDTTMLSETTVPTSSAPAVAVASPAPSSQMASTASGDASDDGTSVAVIIASTLGGVVTVFACVVLVKRFRYYRLESMNQTRYSSEAMLFVPIDATSKATL